MQLSLAFPTTELQGTFPANAEMLFNFLAVDTKFADWITRRITQYGFIENQDYIIQIVYTKGRPRNEYFITLDMAKELCMVENNDKGKEARRYFIECEKELRRRDRATLAEQLENARRMVWKYRKRAYRLAVKMELDKKQDELPSQKQYFDYDKYDGGLIKMGSRLKDFEPSCALPVAVSDDSSRLIRELERLHKEISNLQNRLSRIETAFLQEDFCDEQD